MKQENKTFFAVSAFSSAASITILPIIFGPISFIFAIITLAKGEIGLGIWSLISAVIWPLVGAALGYSGNSLSLSLFLCALMSTLNVVIMIVSQEE